MSLVRDRDYLTYQLRIGLYSSKDAVALKLITMPKSDENEYISIVNPRLPTNAMVTSQSGISAYTVNGLSVSTSNSAVASSHEQRVTGNTGTDERPHSSLSASKRRSMFGKQYHLGPIAPPHVHAPPSRGANTSGIVPGYPSKPVSGVANPQNLPTVVEDRGTPAHPSDLKSRVSSHHDLSRRAQTVHEGSNEKISSAAHSKEDLHHSRTVTHLRNLQEQNTSDQQPLLSPPRTRSASDSGRNINQMRPKQGLDSDAAIDESGNTAGANVIGKTNAEKTHERRLAQLQRLREMRKADTSPSASSGRIDNSNSSSAYNIAAHHHHNVVASNTSLQAIAPSKKASRQTTRLDRTDADSSQYSGGSAESVPEESSVERRTESVNSQQVQKSLDEQDRRSKSLRSDVAPTSEVRSRAESLTNGSLSGSASSMQDSRTTRLRSKSDGFGQIVNTGSSYQHSVSTPIQPPNQPAYDQDEIFSAYEILPPVDADEDASQAENAEQDIRPESIQGSKEDDAEDENQDEDDEFDIDEEAIRSVVRGNRFTPNEDLIPLRPQVQSNIRAGNAGSTGDQADVSQAGTMASTEYGGTPSRHDGSVIRPRYEAPTSHNRPPTEMIEAHPDRDAILSAETIPGSQQPSAPGSARPAYGIRSRPTIRGRRFTSSQQPQQEQKTATEVSHVPVPPSSDTSPRKTPIDSEPPSANNTVVDENYFKKVPITRTADKIKASRRVSVFINIRTVDPVPKPVSALSAMMGKTGEKHNPFAQLYAAFSAKAETNSVKLQIYLPFSEESLKPLRIAVKGDATVEEVIGYTLFEYFDEGRLPVLTGRQLAISSWNLRIVEDDGSIDDDFPALDRSRRIQKFAFDQFALCEVEGLSRDIPSPRSGNPQPYQSPPAVDRREVSAGASDQPQMGSSSHSGGGATGVHVASNAALVGPSAASSGTQGSFSEVKQTTTMQMPLHIPMSEVFDQICRKRKYDPKDYVLKMADVKTDVPLDKTLDQLKATEFCVLKRASGGAGDIFLRPQDEKRPEKEEDDKSFLTTEDYRSVYKQFSVIYKQLMGRHERNLTIDGEYVHLVASEKQLFDMGKSTNSYHISSVVSCKQTKKNSLNFKLIVQRNHDVKVYELESSTLKEAQEICTRITYMSQMYRRAAGQTVTADI